MKSIAFAIAALFVVVLFPGLAQAQTGATFNNPIDAGTFGAGSFSYTDTKTTTGYGNEYNSAGSPFYGQASEDIFYKITVLGDAQVNISHCSSALSDTYLHLLDESGGVIQNLDDNGPLCSGLKASMSVTLPAGTYYIVSEGYGTNNGSITTSISIVIQSVSVSNFLNFTRTWTPQKPFSNVNDILSDSRTVQEVKRVTEYTDGFSRPVQRVEKQASEQQNDIVNMYEYDYSGREVKKYMPFASNVVQSGDVTDDGNYKSSAAAQQIAFNRTIFPGENDYYYARTILENSPLNRVTSAMPQGNSWAGNSRGKSYLYMVNTSVDNVQIWNISLTAGSLPNSAGAYQPGQLYKTMTIDEKGTQRIEYKDKDDQVILQKIQLTAAADGGNGSPHSGWLCTYYVYDDYGNLRWVLTPKMVQQIDGNWTISQSLADELCYRYEYDLLGRQIVKKNPGAEEIWFVYDQAGRLVMSQDGNLRKQKKWKYFGFDDLDRPTSSGLLYDPTNYSNYAFHQSNASVSTSYPNLSLYSTELLSQTYYDNYNWVSGSGSGLSASLDQTNTSNPNYFYPADNSIFPFPQLIAQTQMTRGLVTGNKTEVLGSNATQYLYSVSFYNDNKKLVQTQETNITGGIDKITNQYSWSGVTLRVLEEHTKNGTNSQTHKVVTKMNYNISGSLATMTKTIISQIGTVSIPGTEKTIAAYTYDELGKLKTKALGKNASTNLPLETLTYDYGVRGWLTGINKNFTQAGNTDNYFGMEISYDKSTSTNGTTTFTPLYNGTISGQIWKSKGDAVVRKYDYSYDNLSRLTGAAFLQNAGNSWDKAYMDFSVNNISYDANGNVTSLNQNGFVLGGATPTIDDLTYTYQNSNNSNKLMNVIDNANIAQSRLGDFHYAGTKTTSAVDYIYDESGNQIQDNNKNISSITYNSLNLPLVITVNNKGTITYTYDALGNKLKKIVQETNASVPYNGGTVLTDITTVTTYINTFVYESKTYSNPTLTSLNRTEALIFLAHQEGRARIVYPLYGQPAYFAYDYFIRDNLGNVRVTLTDEQQQDTYPAATLESGGIASEQLFYNIKNDASHVIPTASLPWYASVAGSSYQNNNGVPNPPDPTMNRTQTSANLYKLNGATGDRFGLGITLKVMAGDNISIFAKSVWHGNGQTIDNSNYSINSVLSSFITAFAGTSPVFGGSHGMASGSVLNGNSNTTGPLSSWITTGVPTPGPTTPKAYINWIFFDEQFKPVLSGNGYDPVNSSPDAIKTHILNGIQVPKNGYLYIYCSNESNQDVYFDNLQVIQNRGPVLQESHYYPQGLQMFAISSTAYGKLQVNYGYQGKELQSGEFYDGSGLDEYDFEARLYDPQLARWWVQDPVAQFASPYEAMADNWINGADPNGQSWLGNILKSPWTDLKIIAGLFAWNGNKSFFGNVWSIISRFTWQLPQTIVGLTTSLIQSSLGLVNNVRYFDGATVLRTTYLVNDVPGVHTGSAFTIGNFISGPSRMQIDASDPTFQHEYGRYLQSQADGFTYLTFTAIPDLFSPGNGGKTARDGNARALRYFNQYHGGLRSATNPTGFTWDFANNPISGYNPGLSINDPLNQAALRSNIRKPGFWDFTLATATFFGLGLAAAAIF